MQNKLNFNVVKCLFFFISISLVIIHSVLFSGCSGSDDEEVLTQRQKDSIEIYAHIQESFAFYKKALSENEAGKNAAESFESSLKKLNEVDYGKISKGNTYFWKKDYDELLTSIVQDYFVTQSEINSNSLLFEMAKRVPVEYEKIEHISSDREPLPEGSDVPLEKNSVVDSYIEFFSNTDRGRSFIDKCLYRSGKFFPIMRKILKFNNAPEELIYLSVQESGLNPTIVSRAGAVGLWQFMPATGSAYGLDQDSYRDDRRDFEKATDAAARHLKDLYKTFDDWYLAFAAYNAGPGRVNKAIKRSGSKDFWTLRNFLPGETKNYVPSIIALSFVLRNPDEYGFSNVEYGEQISFDRVEIKSEMSLQKVAELCETDIETIRELNSELTNDIVPQYDVPYELRIPHKSYDKFAENYKKSSDIDKSNGFEPQFAGDETGSYNSIAEIEFKVKNYEPEDKKAIASKIGKKQVSHSLKDKETLLSVSSFYDVRPTDIRVWNDLNYGLNPVKNQKLDVYLSEERYRLLYGYNDADNEQEAMNYDNSNTSTEEIDKELTISKDDGVNENSTESVTDVSGEIDNTESTSSDEYQNQNESNESSSQNSMESDKNADNEEETNVSANETNEDYQYENEPETTETKPVSNSGSLSYYTVKEGDYLSKIAAEKNVTVDELKEWNSLKSDKIIKGQKLKVYGGSSYRSIHTVTAGENLTMIADEYNVSVNDIIELNGLDNDVIIPGQKLKINGVSESKNTKSSASKKTHKVKKGETLAGIANSYNVSLSDLKKWNNIKSDKLLIGQVLKLYDDNSGKTVSKKRKKKN
ncbi:MAG: hypothetical protein HGGPFJEG_02498 [Ignavibacteria bacterium]|nr:hypothetical protein [Ignavibacteria bacterium]